MNDKEYLEALRLRALAIVNEMRNVLSSDIGVPHVTLDRLRVVAAKAARLELVTQAAEAVERIGRPPAPPMRKARARSYSEGELSAVPTCTEE